MLRTAPEIAEKFKRSKVETDDLVYALRGRLGDVKKIPPELHGANLTQGTARLAPKASISSSFLIWAMRDPRILRQAELEAKGTTFKEITLADLRKLKVILPTKKEQERIANALSDADAYIESLEKLIAKKRLIKKGIVQEFLTEKRRLSGFTKKWKEATLSEYATFFKGKGLPKSAILDGGSYSCVHYGELFTQYKETITTIKSSTDSDEDYFLSQSNDVLMPTSDVTPRGLAKASCITLSLHYRNFWDRFGKVLKSFSMVVYEK